MATLNNVSVPAINQHLEWVFDDNKLGETAVVKQYLTTAVEGKNYRVKHYRLQAIIAVGFKLENERSAQSRKLAKAHAETEFEKYRIVQDQLFESDFDRVLKQMGSGDRPTNDHPCGCSNGTRLMAIAAAAVRVSTPILA